MRFLRLAEVRNRVPFGRATIYRLIKTGQFPKPYALGARAVAWLESEVEGWIEGRVNGTDNLASTVSTRATSASAVLSRRSNRTAKRTAPNDMSPETEIGCADA